jgi:hypothetical protein
VGDDRGTVAVVDRSGKRTTLSEEFAAEQGLAWSSRGDEVWFTGGTTSYDLRAVSLSGKHRYVVRMAGDLRLEDVARDGRVTSWTWQLDVTNSGSRSCLAIPPAWCELPWCCPLAMGGRMPTAICEFSPICISRRG